VDESTERAITISMHSQSDQKPEARPDLALGGGSGDVQAVSHQFMEHWDRLHRLVRMRMDRRLHGRVNPSDVLQEAYIEVVRSMPGYLSNPRIPFFQWLRHITVVKLMALHRTHLGARLRDAGREVHLGSVRPQTSSVALAARLLGRLTSPSQAAARVELQVRVQDALGSLEPLDREVLSLRHFEQKTNTEAARILGLSVAAASNRYVRALKRLRPILLKAPGVLGHLSGSAGPGDRDDRS
jgi:RNA polymerase sigma-70 factor, ECF subfamily